MKLPILDQYKNKLGELDLPTQFSEEFRPDLITRAVHALQANSRQRHGADPEAGLRHSSKLTKRRRKYRGCYGLGISRVNRKILSRRGTRFFWMGAFSPQTVGGRRAHPPKSEKIWQQKIDKKENRKAIRSAMGATVNKDLVEKRGHEVPKNYPFILYEAAEGIKRAKEVQKLLKDLGFASELERSLQKKVRAGLGKLRGRKYKEKKGILVVAGDDCALLRAAKNIPGIDAVKIKSLNAGLLAPGAMAGRVTLWTEAAIKKITNDKLFM